MDIGWKKAYGGSLLLHLVALTLLAFFLAGTAAKSEEEQMYVIDLDTSELTSAGSGHAGGGSGALFPEKLSEEKLEARTAAIEQASSAIRPQEAPPEILPLHDAVTAPAQGAAAPSGAGNPSSAGGAAASGAGSGTGNGTGYGSGSGTGTGSGDGAGDGNGYGEGSGAGYGSGDSGAAGTGSAPFDTDGFWSAVNANKSYPPMAIRRGLTGTVTVTVTLDAGGNCVSASASDGGLLGKAALNAVYAACPYPNPTGGSVTISVPVTFELN